MRVPPAQVGAITSEERARWLDTLHAAAEGGHFLGGRWHIFAWGVRPTREESLARAGANG